MLQNKNEDAPSSDSDVDPHPRLPSIPEPSGSAGMHIDVVVPRVPWRNTEWKRCYVSYAGLKSKCWFDNCSDTSGKRRGWMNCAAHGCGCIRYTRESRNYFATCMILWLKHGMDQGSGITKAEHLRFWPSHEDVIAAMPHCEFEDF